MPLRDPAEHEECRTSVVSAQEVEQLPDLHNDARLQPLPVGPRDAGLERRDLKVFFKVDGEMVECHHYIAGHRSYQHFRAMAQAEQHKIHGGIAAATPQS